MVLHVDAAAFARAPVELDGRRVVARGPWASEDQLRVHGPERVGLAP